MILSDIFKRRIFVLKNSEKVKRQQIIVQVLLAEGLYTVQLFPQPCTALNFIAKRVSVLVVFRSATDLHYAKKIDYFIKNIAGIANAVTFTLYSKVTM